MMYRLTQYLHGLPEGACILEFRYKALHYLDRCLWEPIQDYEVKDMIKYDDEKYCFLHNIECLLFYTEHELDKFLNKEYESKTTR
jgi:hypothetical protein